MKKIIIPFILVLETLFILILFLVQNKNHISRNSNVYEIRLDNGCKGKMYFDTTDENQLCGLTLIDEKNNHLNILHYQIRFQYYQIYLLRMHSICFHKQV